MRRLWIRMSLLIGGLLLVANVTTAVLVAVFLPPPVPPASLQPIPPTALGISLRLVNLVAVVIIVGIAVGVIVSRTISAPITRLADAAHRIGAGVLDTRVSGGGSQELVELAHAFNAMADDLQRAEQLRANLMADVAHELRTPLTALEGNLRAALDHVYTLNEAEIANLYSQTRHLIHLVNDLRELALADAHALPLDKQPTDLALLVDETLQVFASQAEEQGVQLIQRLDGLAAIDVDALRIRQVLHNLLANAIRYTPHGGSVTVLGRLDADAVYLTVQDTGAGLAADQVESIFERFYRNDRSRSRDTGGTGLGLAIVKAIVEAHGGRVAAQSNGVGQGLTVAFYLPRHEMTTQTDRHQLVQN
jgi:signal transduction histidine kinase